MRTYILISLVLLAIALTASMPWFRDRGTVGTDLAFKGVSSQAGSKKMIRWVFSQGASVDAVEKGADGVLAFRAQGRPIAFSGLRGGALFLNEGGGGEDLVGHDTGFPAGREPRTVGAWIKTESVTQPAIFNYGTEAPRQRFSLMVSLAGKPMFAGVGDDFEGTTTVNDGEWHLVVITYDGKTANLYVDGELDGSRACDQSTVLNGSCEVGSVRGESSFFTGMIHSLLICNYVLPTGEIRDLATDRPSD